MREDWKQAIGPMSYQKTNTYHERSMKDQQNTAASRVCQSYNRFQTEKTNRPINEHNIPNAFWNRPKNPHLNAVRFLVTDQRCFLVTDQRRIGSLADCPHSSFISCYSNVNAGVRCQGRVMFMF